MDYKVVVTRDAEEDLEHLVHQLKYRRINFLKHRYFMLYRLEDDLVIVDNIFHELQDYENKMY